MKCPKCHSKVRLWKESIDSEPTGIECRGCGMQWKSDSLIAKLHRARHRASNHVLHTTAFPEDASPYSEWLLKNVPHKHPTLEEEKAELDFQKQMACMSDEADVED